MVVGKGIEEIRAVKDRHADDLFRRKNVVGLGIGYKEVEGQETEQLSLVVMVRKKESPSQLEATDLVPFEIEGVPVDVKEVGEIVALSSRNLTQLGEGPQTEPCPLRSETFGDQKPDIHRGQRNGPKASH